MNINKKTCLDIIGNNDIEKLRGIVHAELVDDEYSSIIELIIEFGNVSLMDGLLSEEFDFTYADSLCEYTFMEQSCLLGKIDFVKWFIENSINIRRYRYEFCYAAEKNNIELVKLLLNNGYSASEVDESGRNGLHYAAQENNIDICAGY